MSHGGYTDRDGKHRHSYHHSVITVPLNTAGLSCVIFISQDTRATFRCPEGAPLIKRSTFFNTYSNLSVDPTVNTPRNLLTGTIQVTSVALLRSLIFTEQGDCPDVKS